MSEPPYPRDLVGSGTKVPVLRWPDGAKIAVSLVVNYEEGGENCILHGDEASESVLTDVGANPLKGQRNLNVESIFEYGSRVGFWEVLQQIDSRKLPATVFAVGMALERNPKVAAALKAGSLEVACHGQRWIDYQNVPEAIEREHMRANVETITRLIGRRPVGWYTGRPSVNTRTLVVESGGFLYDSDAYNDDVPYWLKVTGKSHLILPYAFDTNDSRLQRGGDFATGEDYFIYGRDTFDWLYSQGKAGRPRMMSLGLHGRIIGRPGRIGALARLLDHMRGHDGVWFARREDIARHFAAQCPAP